MRKSRRQTKMSAMKSATPRLEQNSSLFFKKEDDDGKNCGCYRECILVEE